MNKSVRYRFYIAFIILISFFCNVLNIPSTISNSNTFEINNFDDLLKYSQLSRQDGFNDANYILKADIAITEDDISKMSSSDVGFLTFGSSDMPFSGTFDGEDHTISNLSFSSSLAIRADTALFSQTNGATIKNLIIDNANLQADFRGGIVAGYADNTLFENIIVKNSHINVAAADNVVTLITDGGIRGGAIAGDAFNSTLYNVEGNNNFVNTNNTSGVAALAGKGLTLAGLVGISNNTTIEYSRVIGGTVKNYYDVVVGAVGGNTLYVGGIVGQMQGTSKVIDSFSTTTLYYYCATYVSVGAGNVGHIGGITARMSGSQNEIIRSHYAGSASSRQYNAALVVPIVQNDKNISGIADIYDGGSVVNTFFKPSLSEGVTVHVLENDGSTSSYGPVDDADYANKDFWKNKDYDMVGNINRNSSYSNSHINKWVMDASLGIPVHGKSINATLDFKGAGSVTIDKTELINKTVTTTNPFYFATQGFDINEKTTTLTASENEDYKFVSWHKESKVFGWEIKEDSAYLNDVVNNNDSISNNKEEEFEFEDSDLFVAHYQALVEYHDIKGNVAKSKYYNYRDSLEEIAFENEPASETASFVGWTTEKSDENGGGYSDISSSKLANLKSSGKLYETGDEIKSALHLYPVYVDLLSNITTIFEGNEKDSLDDVSQRDGIGRTSISLDDNDENIILNVLGTGNDNAFPSGYKFSGWYEGDKLVSSNQKYIISKEDIDLSKKHEFTARFEYAVEYYIKAFYQNNGRSFATSTLYETVYYKYNEDYHDIAAPGYIRENITHFGTSHVGHGQTDTDIDAYTGKITAPLKVYSHNYTTARGSGTAYQVAVDMDFKGSGSIIDLEANTGAKFQFTPASDRYHLLFWTLERDGGLGTSTWSYGENPMGTGSLNSTHDYYATAYVVADVFFHDKEDNVTGVYRKYDDNIFLNNSVVHQYKYYKLNKNTNVTTSSYDAGTIDTTVTLDASPTRTSMQRSGYAFLGFVSSENIGFYGDEWNEMYDVEDDQYTTSSVAKATPYLLDETKEYPVKKSLDIYPVYAKYNVNTKTNVHLLDQSFAINTPPNPTYTLENTEDITREVYITADTNTYVQNNQDKKFKLKNLTVYKNGKIVDTLTSDNGQFTYSITPGDIYVFQANYQPYLVTYHTNTNEMDVLIKDDGEELGKHSNPEYVLQNSEDVIFYGWTTSKPEEGEYHYFASLNDFEDEDITLASESILVSDSMELFPVYIKSNIIINSNIDDYILNKNQNPEDYRVLENQSGNLILTINNSRIDEYGFVGWYKNYVDDEHPGTLVSEDENYRIYSSTLFDETYTAVYKEIYEIKYYDKDKNVIKTVKVGKDESRTFMTTEYLDDEELTVPIDDEVYQLINETLDTNEIFVNWQWVKSDGTVIAFDEFKNEVITQSMNLYPIIETVVVKDADGENLDTVIGIANDEIISSLKSLYEDKYITFDITETKVNPFGNNVVKKNNQNIKVQSDITGEKIVGNDKTNASGLATVYLKDTITLSIESENKDETFVVNILDENDTIVTKVIMKASEEKNIKLSFGNYKAKLDEKWSYRYSSLSENIKINNQVANDAILETSKVKNKWFDGGDYKINKFD